MKQLVNPVRGEVPLTLQKRDYRLVPTWEAVIAVEATLNQSIAAAATRMISGDFRFGDALAIIVAGHQAGGGDLSRADIGEDLLRHGYIKTQDAVLRWCMAALAVGHNGDADEESEESDPGE